LLSTSFARGVDSKLVQRTLRHSRLATTELYLHALEEVPRGAADKMEEILGELRKAGS
jgi:site-specific recombinase XerD